MYLSIDQGFTVNILNRDIYSEPIEYNNYLNCYSNSSKFNEHTGVGVAVKRSLIKGGLSQNEAFHLDQHNTVLQAELFFMGKTATFLLDNTIEDIDKL